MRYAFVVAGLAAIAGAQDLDFAAVDAAPAPIATGPAVTAAAETITYNAAASGSAAVTGVVTASATASQSPNQKRDLEKRTITWCYWWWIPYICPATDSSTSSTSTTTATCTTCSSTGAAKTTSSSATTTSSTSTSSMITSTAYNSKLPTPTAIPSTCTNTWTNTFAFTSASGCPTPFEVGTYCGFVNPEDPCADQPDGYGPVASPDTVAAFKATSAFHSSAKNAKAPTGYASTFTDLDGATSAASYLGLQTLKSYDVSQCGSFCDNTTTCTSFNIYVERDPKYNPSTTYCCPNPVSITNYKCTLWGSIIDNTTATNVGQTREQFQVAITASNGYTKANTTTPATPSGWTNPQKCEGAHSHPTTCIGKKFFPGPYNPQLCASYAQAQNLKNGASTGRNSLYSANTCNFFNAYMLKKNKKPVGTYCSLFAEQYESKWATYFPGVSGGNSYDVETSWSFCLS